MRTYPLPHPKNPDVVVTTCVFLSAGIVVYYLMKRGKASGNPS
jgi:hypothetical protein